ncbi:MAG TPA: 50S ribosomal protein L4 [Acidimicrobiales bacterium]|nr:50S ribosomal protein L4 [Acidimicrobiales bacterium]
MTLTDTVLRGPVKKDRPALTTRTVKRRNMAGHDLGQVELEPTIFGLEPNRAVLHQVITAQLAAVRSGTQSTKTRSEVRGGGAKPFNQKGTGRARQGSSRSPSQSGGGVALGPKPRSYRQHTPKKMVHLALLSALSDRAIVNRIALVDQWEFEEPKTKAAALALRKLKLNGSVLVVLADDETVAARSFANLPDVSLTSYGQLSAHDVLRADWILFSDRTLPGLPAEPAAESMADAAADAAPAKAPAAKKARATKKAAVAVAPAAEEPASDEATEEVDPDA